LRLFYVNDLAFVKHEHELNAATQFFIIHILILIDIHLLGNIAKESILRVLNANEYIMQGLPKEILLAEINDSRAEIKVLFSINNINSEQLAKSLILAAIYNTLKQKEISIL
jgi:hypothetical protein